MGGPSGMLGADRSQLGDAKFDRNVVRRVLHFARPYRWMLVGYLAVIVVIALIQLVPPLIFRQIIDEAIPQGINEGDRGLLHLLAAVAVAAAVGSAAMAIVERWLSARIGEGVIYDLRVAVFGHVQRMPISFFTRTQTGALTNRLNSDVIGAQRALTTTIGGVASNVITLVTTLIAMALLEWRLTLLSLVVLPLFIVPARRVGRRLQAVTRTQMDLNASMNTTMTERFNVSGALLVKLFGRTEDEERSFAERADGVRRTGIRAALYGRTFFIALGLVGAIGTAAVYWVGGLQVINGTLSLGTLVALAAYVTRLYGPLTALSNAHVDLLTAMVSFERVFEVLDAPLPLVDKPGAADLVDPRGRIDLDDVHFTYPDQVVVPTLELDPTVGLPRPVRVDGAPRSPVDGNGEHGDGDGRNGAAPRREVLHGVSAVIEPGELVALVGPSGGGKTTLSMLVPRLYDVSDGAVRIDGHDVRDLTQDSLHAAIGAVTQDPHLFHDTVGNNLRYARPDASDDELVAAARAAQIHDVIAALPEGYDTLVGERGYRLSGGEKQRLAIARMLLKDPAVVILDEATSQLDSENEAAIQRALAEALAGRTSIVIAHRLSTITTADQILVLDGGRIVERGTHADLLAAGGLYAELYRTLVRSDLAGPGPATVVDDATPLGLA
ncbi:MAG TPA: ABC transporter ATP-binding protein [Acidimicrobiales bacterium]|nr:ABC transporter ATP-binding protein [Acidimicrobiales bacterium]